MYNQKGKGSIPTLKIGWRGDSRACLDHLMVLMESCILQCLFCWDCSREAAPSGHI